jgi:hypothetical protein
LVSDIREERRQRVLENKALRRIFRPKRDEVTGGWRKLQNEGLQNDQVEDDEIGKECSTNESIEICM